MTPIGPPPFALIPPGWPPLGHNGGPPLDEHPPPWGEGDPLVWYYWSRAHRRAWRNPPDLVLEIRLRNAAALGMSYRDYTAVLLDTGRYLEPPPAHAEPQPEPEKGLISTTRLIGRRAARGGAKIRRH